MSNSTKYRPVIKDISTSLLAEGKTIRIKAHGYSMYPAIKPGTILIIDPVQGGKDPVVGEIVAIKRETGLVVHRITKIEIIGGTRYYTARGDSNAWNDQPVRKEKILGRIVRVEATYECPQPASVEIITRPSWFLNRLKVITILIFKKIRKKISNQKIKI
jgi:signal peptidase I